MSNINISEATIALIDSLKSTTGAFGLAGTGSEYKIVTEMFLYKFFNDKFGYEAKRDEVYGERLRNAEKLLRIRLRRSISDDFSEISCE